MKSPLTLLSILWQWITSHLLHRTPPHTDRGYELEKKLILRVTRPRFLPTAAQFQYLPRILKRSERRLFGIAFLVFIAATLALIWGSALRFGTFVATQGGNFSETLIGQPQLVNPLWADANDVDRDLVRLIFAGLFKATPALGIEPDLAESFTISEDGKTYTVTLRRDTHFHDGAPLTASDVVFTIATIKNPAYRSPRAADFRGVTITAPDDRTVVFTLETPFSAFPHSLTVGIIPEHLWQDVAPEFARLAELNLKPIGAGPYRFLKLKKTKQGTIHSYLLAENALFHGKKPNISTLTFRFAPDYAGAADLLAEGNVDGLAFIPRSERERMAREKHLTYYRLELPQITAIFFNQKQNPVISEKSVRAALAKAIDKPRLIQEVFSGEAMIIHGPILEGFLGFSESVSRYDFDLAATQALLDEIDFKLKEGATVRTFEPKQKSDKRFSPGTELKLTVTTVNVPEYVRAAELIRDAWQAVGVGVEIITADPRSMDREIIPNRNYQALLYGEILASDPDPYPFWHSSQAVAPGVNLSGYANRRIDALIEEARTLQNPEERAKRYEEFQTIITADLPAIFLFTPYYTYAMSDKVKGISLGKLGNPADRFSTIADWYVKTRWRLR